MTSSLLRKTALVIAACALGLAGALPSCTYSKSYFRLDENGKMIKADGPIEPGEFDGILTGSDTGAGMTGGTGTGGSTAGDDGTIVPPDGTGTGTATGSTTSGTSTGASAGTTSGGSTDNKAPAYALAYMSMEKSSKKSSIGFGVVNGNEFVVDPKLLVTSPDSNTMIQGPAVSPDGRRILYTTYKTGSTAPKTPVYDLRVLSNLSQATPGDALWKGNYGGIFAAWMPAGDQVVYSSAGCSVLKRANADASGEKDEAAAPTGTAAGSIFGQIAPSPVTDSSNPASGWIVFSLVSLNSSKTGMQGSELFAKKAGDTDAAHFVALTATSTELEQDPAVSPDGKYLAYTVQSTALGGHRVKICDLSYASGSIKCSNSRFLYPVEDLDNFSPCWSWDGQKLFFSSDDTSNKNIDVFVATVTGGAASGKPPVNLTDTDGADESQLSCAAAVDHPVEPAPSP
jgi:hypothetical protein